MLCSVEVLQLSESLSNSRQPTISPGHCASFTEPISIIAFVMKYLAASDIKSSMALGIAEFSFHIATKPLVAVPPDFNLSILRSEYPIPVPFDYNSVNLRTQYPLHVENSTWGMVTMILFPRLIFDEVFLICYVQGFTPQDAK